MHSSLSPERARPSGLAGGGSPAPCTSFLSGFGRQRGDLHERPQSEACVFFAPFRDSLMPGDALVCHGFAPRVCRVANPHALYENAIDRRIPCVP